MGASSSRVKLTASQGQFLFRLCGGFTLPDKLGEKDHAIKFELVERAEAADQVRALWRELKSRSPLWAKERKSCFGPADNWEPDPREDDKTNMKLKDQDREVEIVVTESVRWGIYWILLLMVHPASPIVRSAAIQEDVVWPVAEKVRATTKLKKALGTYNVQAKPFEMDAEPEDMAGGETTDDTEEVEDVGVFKKV